MTDIYAVFKLPIVVGKFLIDPMMLFSKGLLRWDVRFWIGPCCVTMAWIPKPTKATCSKAMAAGDARNREAKFLAV